MGTVALLDVNVLVALFHAEHVHHELAHDWFADHRADGWATCPLTENGFLRVSAQLAEGDATLRPHVIADHLRRLCADTAHAFWPDAVSLLDDSVFDLRHVRGHRQLTDVYLLGLARSRQGSLATFDDTIPLAAVVGATRRHLEVISG
jgi:toxin-antitoxin system PIN domain toxin